MKISWRIGRIFGIDIYLDASWLVIFGLFTWIMASSYFPGGYPRWPTWQYWVVGAFTSLLLFASVLGHELAHSLMAIRQGEKVRRITLFILGGVAQITEEPKEASKEFFMAFVGPLTSFIIAGVCYVLFVFLRPLSEPLAAIARYLSFINVLLGAFNLLPGFPMDGGRVLRAIIWKLTGNLKTSTSIAASVGQGFAFFFIIVGFFMIFRGMFVNGIWIMMIGWFLHSAAGQGYHQIIVKEMLAHVRAEDLMDRHVQSISGNLTIQKLVDEFIFRHQDRTFLISDRGEIEGIISLEDVKKIPRERWPTTRVTEAMTPRENLSMASPDDDGNKVLAQLTNKRVHQVPVVKDGKIEGIVTRTGILHFLQLRSDLGV